MGHAEIENHTDGAVVPLFVSDRDGRPISVFVVKMTWKIGNEGLSSLISSNILLDGEFYGSPDSSSYKYEPETAYTKPNTDIVLIGHAHPPHRNLTKFDVRLQVGNIEKVVRVVGNRVWGKRFGIIDMTNPETIQEPIPLTYERAFGGWDAADPDPMSSRFEPRNPVGVGYKRRFFEEGLPLPNLEDPRRPLVLYGDTPPPAGFGFVSPHWQPRAMYAGTYDAAWQKDRAPYLPVNFDERFFNAASTGLVAPEYLRGDEPVSVENATPSGRLAFRLPNVASPLVQVHLLGGKRVPCVTRLDTVIVNTDEMLLMLLWRNHIVLRDGPHDIVKIIVAHSIRGV